jgi:hypothetical protein
MNNSVTKRLVDDTIDAYVDWREQCARVRAAYRRWSTAPRIHLTEAFDEYLAALNDEEDAADQYAQLIGRLGRRASFRPHNEPAGRSARSWWRRDGGVTRDL